MERSLQIRKLTSGSLFKLLLIGVFIGYSVLLLILLSISQGVLEVNPIPGVSILVLIVACPIAAVLSAFGIWLLLAPALWFYSLLGPVEITVVFDHEPFQKGAKAEADTSPVADEQKPDEQGTPSW